MSLTVAQVIADLRMRLGIMPGDTVPTGADADCILAINWALQTIAKGGADYFRREAISVPLSVGVSAYTLAADTQEVLGPVYTKDRRILTELGDFSEVQEFGSLYLGQVSSTLINGAPLAFFSRAEKTTGGDSHSIVIYVLPAPDAAAVTTHSPISVDGVKNCPRFTVADVASNSEIPVADGYSESLFLPLARLQVTRSHIFSQLENLPRIKEDADMAMRTLGLDTGSEANTKGNQ